MQVQALTKKMNLKVIAGDEGLAHEITGGYASDLLSDVMGHAQAGQIWVTLQTHKNVIAVASLKDLAAVLIVKGQEVAPNALQQANDEGIPVLLTDLPAFEAIGKVYALLDR